MALTNPQRIRARQQFVEEVFMADGAAPCAFTKDDLLAAAQAIDGWIDANQASFNNALPEPFKSGANASQKAALFMCIVERRFRG